jgi:hypothetical protein
METKGNMVRDSLNTPMGPLSFRYQKRDGTEGLIQMFDPPSGHSSLPLSERRNRLKEMVDEARKHPEEAEFVYIFEQVVASMYVYLKEHGDFVLDAFAHSSQPPAA